MRRLRSFIVALLSILLLGLCIVAAIISRHHALRWGFSTLHNRYTFLIDHERLLFRASPPPRKEDAEAWELLKRLRNEDIQWTATWFHFAKSAAGGTMLGPGLVPRYKEGSVAWKVSKLSTSSDELFLRALDSKQKFVAAHVLLADRHTRGLMLWIPGTPPNSPLSMDFQGVQFHLRTALRPPQLALGATGTVPILDSDITVVPGQLSTIRNYWHDALDQTILSISMWWMAGGATLLIALQCAGALRRVKRLRSGQCVHCGYDLRASTGVCPECGSPIPKNASAPPTV